MFESAEVGRTIPKSEYKERVPELRQRLVHAQHRLRTVKRFPLILMVGGDDWPGCNDLVNRLHEWMDARYLRLYPVERATQEERARPRFWRFWRVLPPRGGTAIFLGGWTLNAIVRRIRGEESEDSILRLIGHIRRFERSLVDDGAVLLKFWLHDSGKKALDRWNESLAEWTLDPNDDPLFEDRDAVLTMSEPILRETSLPDATWQIIESRDARYRDLTVGERVLEALESRLGTLNHPIEPIASTTVERVPADPIRSEPEPTVLDTVDLTKTIDRDDYDRKLDRWQERLRHASQRARRLEIGSVLAFEGWDAAGKGGVIRRMTRAMDARNYRGHSIAAPTDEELARPHLWRFWRRIPRMGRMGIFDRTWYGRVLVERVEGFASEEEWGRAYAEINDFESELVEAGYVVLKFWLHIDPDEQLRRFRDRERVPFKRFKITDEDWRNRDRYEDYTAAVHDMVEKTSTDTARWHLVPFNSKHYGRIEVLKTVVNALERAIEERQG